MGLDISLIKLTKNRNDALRFIDADDSPELENIFGEFKTTHLTLETSGYYYDELSHQRRGVKPGFYQRYKSDEFLHTMIQLEELREYIDDKYIETFEKEFILKFKELETIVMMGY